MIQAPSGQYKEWTNIWNSFDPLMSLQYTSLQRVLITLHDDEGQDYLHAQRSASKRSHACMTVTKLMAHLVKEVG